jgi:hypothetical protein
MRELKVKYEFVVKQGKIAVPVRCKVKKKTEAQQQKKTPTDMIPQTSGSVERQH